MKWRVVPDWAQTEMFGVSIEIDESSLLKGLEQYIASLKDRYNPTKDVLYCKLVPDPDSFRKELR